MGSNKENCTLLSSKSKDYTLLSSENSEVKISLKALQKSKRLASSLNFSEGGTGVISTEIDTNSLEQLVAILEIDDSVQKVNSIIEVRGYAEIKMHLSKLKPSYILNLREYAEEYYIDSLIEYIDHLLPERIKIEAPALYAKLNPKKVYSGKPTITVNTSMIVKGNVIVEGDLTVLGELIEQHHVVSKETNPNSTTFTMNGPNTDYTTGTSVLKNSGGIFYGKNTLPNYSFSKNPNTGMYYIN